MQQLAWLHAIPDKPAALGRANELSQTMSRLQQHQHHGTDPAMPPAGPAAYLVGYLFDAGPIACGFGEAPLSHADIAAWQANSGITLQAWESQTLRHMSHSYLASLQRARTPDCPPPYCAPETDDARARIADRVRTIFGNRKAH